MGVVGVEMRETSQRGVPMATFRKVAFQDRSVRKFTKEQSRRGQHIARKESRNKAKKKPKKISLLTPCKARNREEAESMKFDSRVIQPIVFSSSQGIQVRQRAGRGRGSLE